MPPRRVNVAGMERDELSSKQPDDPLVQLARQDLDPLSIAELHARIAMLEAEIARSQGKIAVASRQRLDAEALFKR
jgi:uncharacterized small protein (DUF1192 family)